MKIGIAGKMASGKTLIAAELEKHGFKIFPLDGYARKLRKKAVRFIFFSKKTLKMRLKKTAR